MPNSIERIAAEVGSNDRHHHQNAENISMKWGCSVTAEKNTPNNTTQEWIRSVVMPLTRLYQTNLLSQDLCRLRTRFYTDILFLKAKSVSGHTCAQIFTDGKSFVWIMTFFSKDEVDMALREFKRQLGIPNDLHFDRAAEYMGLHSDVQCKIG